MLAAFVAIGDACGAPVLGHDPGHFGVQLDREVGIVRERGKKGIGRRAAPPGAVGELVEADAPLRGAVEVGIERLAQLLQSLHEPARHFVDVAGIRDQNRPVGAVQIVGEAVVALHAAKIGQHVLPAPADPVIGAAQHVVPAVIIRRTAPHVDLRIDRRTAAQHVALGDVVDPSVQMRLRLCPVVTHEFGAVDHLEDARRHVEQGVAVGMPGFEQQDLGARVDQTCGGCGPG